MWTLIDLTSRQLNSHTTANNFQAWRLFRSLGMYGENVTE